MRICIDLDGTICKTREPHQNYIDVEPLPDAIKSIQELKAKGHTIIIYTARHMKTCNNSLGLIVVKQLKTIMDWLDKHNIPYDELWPGKPLADYYIDDKCIPYTGNWNEIKEKLC